MDHDTLSSLLNDPEALQNAISAVSGMLGGTAAAGTQPPASDYDPTAELMEKALPVISTIVQSGQSAVKQEKRALLGALKPFVTEQAASQFDHAVRLVSLANMARAAMGQLNRTGREEDSAPRAL